MLGDLGAQQFLDVSPELLEFAIVDFSVFDPVGEQVSVALPVEVEPFDDPHVALAVDVFETLVVLVAVGEFLCDAV